MDAVFSFLFGTRTGFAILFAGGILLFAVFEIGGYKKD